MRIIKLFALFFLTCACNETQEDRNPEWIVIEDGACYMETQRAKIDYEKGILKYVVYEMNLDTNIDKSIKNHLSKYNIDFINNGENCLGDSNCYGQYMASMINQKYGKSFLDSIVNECRKKVDNSAY